MDIGSLLPEKVNKDEDRQVGHYWLRNPVIAPAGYGDNIKEVWQQLKEFSARPDVAEFQNILWIGIGTYYQYKQWCWYFVPK